ncbi:MAG: helix-turn-helix transcriptional regulator [Firmicutes bacterium]|nr:helix-turn-helix transcriptional regulator [Bacillota bacterium]
MNSSFCTITTDDHGRELISHGTPQFPIACYHDELHSSPVSWHWHDEFELVLITDGEATAAADARRSPVTTGNGFFVNSGVLHSILAADANPCCFHSIVFHPRLVGGTVDSVFWEKYIHPITTSHSQTLVPLNREVPHESEILDFIEAVWKLCLDAPSGFEIDVRHKLTQMMMKLADHLPAFQPENREKSIRDAERIKMMLRFIQDHYGEELTLGQISESAMISESECLRCFHSTIETTPIQYLKDYRLQKAAELLASSRGKVSDIASQCGFQEMSYFARIFRHRYGITPTQYRSKKE